MGLSQCSAGVLPLLLLSAGHLCVDVYSGALGALQPLLVDRFGLSLTAAGLLGGALVFSSSVMQPFYGYLSDRLRTRLFAGLGPAVAGVFISSLGLAGGFYELLAMVLLGGAGIAAFHPQASSRALEGVGERRGGSMAVFISAGTLGMACGPAFFSLLAGSLGLRRIYWGALPGIILTVLLIAFVPAASAGKRAVSGFDWRVLRDVWRPLSLLYTLVFIRSIVQITFSQFIPLYLHLEKGYSVTAASLALTLYMACGAVGGFVGGHLADRLGGRFVIVFSMIGSVPFLLVFFLAPGWLSVAGLALGGLVLLFTVPVNVVMAQNLAPAQAGTVSALMMGFAWGTAGLIFIPLTGRVADLFSMHYALLALVAFPLLGFFLSLRLPKRGDGRL